MNILNKSWTILSNTELIPTISDRMRVLFFYYSTDVSLTNQNNQLYKDTISWISSQLTVNRKVQTHTVLMSGFAVTICFSAGKCLFCLNSASPEATQFTWQRIRGEKTERNTHFTHFCFRIRGKLKSTNSSCQVQSSIDPSNLDKSTSFQNPIPLNL